MALLPGAPELASRHMCRWPQADSLSLPPLQLSFHVIVATLEWSVYCGTVSYLFVLLEGQPHVDRDWDSFSNG